MPAATDQKKLREMMRAEKQRRASEAAATTVVRQPPSRSGDRSPAQKVRKVEAESVPAHVERFSGRADCSNNGGGEDIAAPKQSHAQLDGAPQTMPRPVLSASALTSPSPVPPAVDLPLQTVVSSGKDADALAMPPPPIPMLRKVSRGDGSQLTSGGAPNLGPLIGPMLPTSESEGRNASQRTLAASVGDGVDGLESEGSTVFGAPVPILEDLATGSSAGGDDCAPSINTTLALSKLTSEAIIEAADDADGSVGAPNAANGIEGMEDADDAYQELPQGFFDDPELDAKVRGVEAPSVRAERELEEGLKRFQQEMAIETERAEETRNELDENKYEEAYAEEQDFSNDLQDRAKELRRRLQEATALASKAETLAGGARGTEDSDDDDDASDSDVEFDWRAKGLG